MFCAMMNEICNISWCSAVCFELPDSGWWHEPLRSLYNVVRSNWLRSMRHFRNKCILTRGVCFVFGRSVFVAVLADAAAAASFTHNSTELLSSAPEEEGALNILAHAQIVSRLLPIARLSLPETGFYICNVWPSQPSRLEYYLQHIKNDGLISGRTGRLPMVYISCFACSFNVVGYLEINLNSPVRHECWPSEHKITHI